MKSIVSYLRVLCPCQRLYILNCSASKLILLICFTLNISFAFTHTGPIVSITVERIRQVHDMIHITICIFTSGHVETS